MASPAPGFDLLHVFVAVAQAGGFTAAAHRLGTTKAMVSQRIAMLEAQLGVLLFTRSTRKVVLTQAGERLLLEAAPLLDQLRAAMAGASQGETIGLHGLLRVTAGAAHLSEGLAELLSEFLRMHPGLELDVLATDAVVDLIGEGVDVAIRRGWLRDSSLTATSLGTFKQYVVASPVYAKERGLPTRPRELSDHRAVALTRLRSPMTWEFSGRDGETVVVRLKNVVTCNSPLGVVTLARAGIGIAIAGEPTVREELARGTLLRVLPSWKLPDAGVFAVFPSSQHVPAKTRAFVEFLKSRMRRTA